VCCADAGKVASVAAGRQHAVAVMQDGTAYHWGARQFIEPQLLTVMKGHKVVQVLFCCCCVVVLPIPFLPSKRLPTLFCIFVFLLRFAMCHVEPLMCVVRRDACPRQRQETIVRAW